MGLNAFFTFGVVIGMKIPWQTALTGVLISGIIFVLLSLSGIREKIINAIPAELKFAVGAGIGLFITFVGFQSSGIIVNNPDTLVGLGGLTGQYFISCIWYCYYSNFSNKRRKKWYISRNDYYSNRWYDF